MAKEKIIKVSEVMGFSPAATKGSYVSKLIIDSGGLGSSKLMLVHATLKPQEVQAKGFKCGVHPAPYDESYYILSGQGRIAFGENGEEIHDVGPDTAVLIPAGTAHAIMNTGTEDLVFLSIWPLAPQEEGVNPVYDERKKTWGKSFRKLNS